MTGKIKTLKQGRFGFIRADTTGTEYFFHIEDLVDCEFRELVEDRTVVEFEVAESPKGPRAENVRLVQ